MEFKVSQIAEMLGGIVEGNQEAILNNIAKIEEAKENFDKFQKRIRKPFNIYHFNILILLLFIIITLKPIDKPSKFNIFCSTFTEVRSSLVGLPDFKSGVGR